MYFAIMNPTAACARGIENIVKEGEETKNIFLKAGCCITSRVASVTVFPIFVGLELVFKRIPKALTAISFKQAKFQDGPTKFNRRLDKIAKFVLGFFATPLGLISPDAVSTLFLKLRPTEQAIKPFGVEKEFGKKVDGVHYPKNQEELLDLVNQGISEQKQISVIGAGMSQGSQTVPEKGNHLVIHTKHLNEIEINTEENTVKVGAGCTWEQIQIALNKVGKSVIVKQASDPFSVGGSIGINCHGWAHEEGSISSVVNSIEMIDAEGNLRTLTPKDELFGCMFGTLGYFGVIVSVNLKITDNEHLIEKTEDVPIEEFHQRYITDIKGQDIPLFGGRLPLDIHDGDPMGYVAMVRYEKDEKANAAQKTPLITKNFTIERKRGTRFQRVGLQLISHLSKWFATKLIAKFWESELKNMHEGNGMTRNEALHPPINGLMMHHHSNLHAQWLQEYFVKPENLPDFLHYLGEELKQNDVRLINGTIRPTPKDTISILPYADQDRYAVVICFYQKKTKSAIEKTRQWIQRVNQYVMDRGDVYYQAYMPYATKEEFEKCYGTERVEKMRALKKKYDPQNIFGNAHTAKYFDVS